MPPGMCLERCSTLTYYAHLSQGIVVVGTQAAVKTTQETETCNCKSNVRRGPSPATQPPLHRYLAATNSSQRCWGGRIRCKPEMGMFGTGCTHMHESPETCLRWFLMNHSDIISYIREPTSDVREGGRESFPKRDCSRGHDVFGKSAIGFANERLIATDGRRFEM